MLTLLHHLTALALLGALACAGCSTIHEYSATAPFERVELMHRNRLGVERLVRVALRQEASGVAIRLEKLVLCRDELAVTRGIENRTERSIAARDRTARWITFGAFATLTVLSVAAYSGADCSPEATVCADKALAYGGLLVTGAGTAVSGAVLGIDYLRATDSSTTLSQARSVEQRVQVCGREPWSGVLVEAVVLQTRATASTDALGEARLAIEPRQRATPIDLTIDGARLGTVVAVSEWRTAVIRR